MKKILAMIVAIMMVLAMAIPAMAELVVIQDGKAPKVLTEGVTLTDVSERKADSAMAAMFAAHLNHHQVVTEMFEVAVEIPAGETKTVTVEAKADSAVFTADGASWETLAVKTEGDTVSFDLKAAGTVALLVDFVAGMFDDITVTDIEALTTEVIQQFTPSVAGKAAPALKETVNLVKGEEKVAVQPTYLIITPLALSEYTDDIVTHELLQWAYDNIINNGPQTVAAEVDKVLEGTGLTYDKMIVHDLFETSLYGADGIELAKEGVELSFQLDAAFEKGATVVVLYSADAANWTVLPLDGYTVNEDGTIDLTMETLGAIAFMVEAEPEAVITSPAN